MFGKLQHISSYQVWCSSTSDTWNMIYPLWSRLQILPPIFAHSEYTTATLIPNLNFVNFGIRIHSWASCRHLHPNSFPLVVDVLMKSFDNLKLEFVCGKAITLEQLSNVVDTLAGVSNCWNDTNFKTRLQPVSVDLACMRLVSSMIS